MPVEGMDTILAAEKEADELRKAARAEAEALLANADSYRERALETARREGEEARQRLLENAGVRARERLRELKVVAEVRNSSLRSDAEGKLDSAAAWIAERIAGF